MILFRLFPLIDSLTYLVCVGVGVEHGGALHHLDQERREEGGKHLVLYSSVSGADGPSPRSQCNVLHRGAGNSANNVVHHVGSRINLSKYHN